MSDTRLSERERQGATASAEEVFSGRLTAPIRRSLTAIVDLVGEHPDAETIFTARKAYCVADVLRDFGILARAEGLASTRIFDGDCEYLAGRHVILVEDIVSSGMTLRRAVNAVAAWGPSKITCIAMSVEGKHHNVKTWFSADVRNLLDLRIKTKATPQESLAHAQGIVRALASVPRPLNIDWPIYGALDDIDDWEIGDYPANLIAHDQASMSPTFTIPLDAPWAHASGPFAWLKQFAKDFQLSKVRAYPLRPHHFKEWSAQVVPICALGFLQHRELDRLYAASCDHLGPLLDHNPSQGEKYRALQYVLSDALLWTSFHDRMRLESGHAPGLRALFSPRHHVALTAALGQVRVQASNRPSPVHDAGLATFRSESSAWLNSVEDLVVAQHVESAVTHDFLQRYQATDEYALRQRLRQTGDPQEIEAITNTLAETNRVGAATDAGELREIVREELTTQGFDVSRLDQWVSTTLDLGIDRGTVVPELFTSAAGIGRKFRPGEVIEFSEQTLALVEMMLIGFQDASARRSLDADLLQKLLVGTLRFLIRQQVVEDLRGLRATQAGDTAMLQVRYHKRGAVLDEVSSSFVADEPVPLSLSLLARANVLKLVGGNDRYPTYELAPTRAFGPTEHDVQARVFGAVMARFLHVCEREPGHRAGARARTPGRGVRPSARSNRADSFAKLITLSGGLDEVLAIGADIAIATNLLHKRRVYPTLEAWEDSHLHESVLQGLDKMLWTTENLGSRIIERVDSELDDPYLRSGWEGIVSSLREGSSEQEFMQIRRRQRQWLADAYVFCVAVSASLARPSSARALVESKLGHERWASIASSPQGRRRSKTSAFRLVDQLRSFIEQERAVLPSLDAISQLGDELVLLSQDVVVECHRLDAESLGIPGSGRSDKWRHIAAIFTNVRWDESSVIRLKEEVPHLRRAFAPNDDFDDIPGVPKVIAQVKDGFSPGDAHQILAHARSEEAGARLLVTWRLPPFLAPSSEHQVVRLSEPLPLLLDAASAQLSEEGAIVVWLASEHSPKDLIDAGRTTDFEALGLQWHCAPIAPSSLSPHQRSFDDPDAEYHINVEGDFVDKRQQNFGGVQTNAPAGNVAGQNISGSAGVGKGDLHGDLRTLADSGLSAADTSVVATALDALEDGSGEAPPGLLTGLSAAGIRVAEQLGLAALRAYLGLP